ncbi:hypothetical protein QBC45DRAFT_202333 [Copromyces sp. CBS 386.78]|nr:hypothetical protein QBC45DRAFT_202333 [Copromyces sp. CBS 386.78]
MAPTTQNTSTQEVQELDTTPVASPSEPPTTPRTRSFSSLSSPSSSSSTSSFTTAVTTQQQPQRLDVTPSVFSNIVAAGTDASFLGYTETATQTPVAPTGTLPLTRGTSTSGVEAKAEASSAAPHAHVQAQGTASVQKNTSIPLCTARTLEALELEMEEDLSEAEREARAWERLQRQKEAFQRVIPGLVIPIPVDDWRRADMSWREGAGK